jgi:hypothetical protein
VANAFGQAIILFWPLVAAVLFLRLPRPSAIVWTLIAGYMLMPNKTGFNLPLVPTLNKENMPVFAAALMCMLGVGAARSPIRRGSGTKPLSVAESSAPRSGWLPESLLGKALLAILLAGPVFTALTNRDPVVLASGRVLPGLGLYDAGSTIINTTMMILPFLIGRRYIRSVEDHRKMIGAIIVVALIYTIPTLYEIRMSPQLHTIVYGFFPHNFAQVMRYGGWRPMVFMEHGLRLAILFAMFLGLSAATWRASRGPMRMRALAATVWLVIVLVLCKSTGALILASAFVPVIMLAGMRTQLLTAAVTAVIVLIYPVLRGSGVLSAQRILAPIELIAPDRVSSLAVRLLNEDILLARASQRPIFGWGGWSRSRVFSPETGQDMSVTDGVWVITMGQSGWVGYLALFGLLTLPLLILFFRRSDRAITLETTGLAVVLSINFIDMLPNSSMTPVTFLLSGALLGRVEALTQETTRTLREARSRSRPAFAAGRRGLGDAATAARR